MGILVVGAEKVEREVEQLKRNLKTLTTESRTRNVAQMHIRWNDVKSSVEGTRARLATVTRRIQPFRNRLENETETLLHRTNINARMMLLGTIDTTIAALEKARRKLDRSCGYAS